MKSISPVISIRSRTILGYTALFAMIMQFLIITYNTITGFIRVESMAEFLFRVAYGTLVSTILGLLIIWPDLLVINRLNNKVPWNRAILKRVALQAFLAIVIATAISVTGTALVNLIHPYTDELPRILFINASIASVVNLLLMAVLEAAVFYRQNRLSRLKNQKLLQELSEIRFEMLKTQINPHFLFNSLNVLSGLIEQDTRKAQSFIEAFAKIYHYVLETIEKQVVTLEEELKFARSYIYLQQIRHGDQIGFTVNLSAESLRMMLPPLSLQIVLENAFKHNATCAGQPLIMTLTNEGNWLLIRNVLLPRKSVTPSTGIGQKNLSRRYAMICGELPQFGIENDQYLVKLPLIPCEN